MHSTLRPIRPLDHRRTIAAAAVSHSFSQPQLQNGLGIIRGRTVRTHTSATLATMVFPEENVERRAAEHAFVADAIWDPVRCIGF